MAEPDDISRTLLVSPIGAGVVRAAVTAKIDQVTIEMFCELVQQRSKEPSRIRAKIMEANKWRVTVAVTFIIKLDVTNTDRLAEPVSSAI